MLAKFQDSPCSRIPRKALISTLRCSENQCQCFCGAEQTSCFSCSTASGVDLGPVSVSSEFHCNMHGLAARQHKLVKGKRKTERKKTERKSHAEV